MKLLVPLLSLATFALAAVSSKAELPPRPNIVFIYSDDLRWDALGAVQREQGEKARFP